MKKEHLQLLCAGLAIANFSIMALFGLEVLANGIVLGAAIAIDLLAAWLVLQTARRRPVPEEPEARARVFFKPISLLKISGAYGFLLTIILLAFGHFSRQAAVLLALGLMSCFLAVKVAEIIDTRLLEGNSR